MAMFLADDADHYGGTSSGSYFKLEDDGDSAFVRLLGNDMNDFPGYACHEVKVGRDEQRRLVNCLRNYKDPIDVCPFCAAKKKVIAKLFIPLLNTETDEIMVWERGKSMFKKLSNYCARHKNVIQYITEVVRNGKKRDTSTTYDFYDDGNGPDTSIHLEDYEVPEILGRYILDKTAEDMKFFLETGEFPGDEEDDMPVRRRESSSRRGARGGRRVREEDEEY